jgi:hypothetical protein
MPPRYTVTSTKNTFLLRTTNHSASKAQSDCNVEGGHLASYVNRAEQEEVSCPNWRLLKDRCCTLAAHECGLPAEHAPHLPRPQVEKYYIDNGYLFPKYHLFYWMGLTTPTADPQVDGMSAGSIA